MCAASTIAITNGKRAVFNSPHEQIQIASGPRPEVDSRREVAFSRVVEAVQKTVQFVIGTASTSTRIIKKRKITEDDSGHSTAKKPKTSCEACMNKADSDRDNVCSICLAPWSTCGDHRLTSLKCGHLFGQSCIVTWIKRSHNCPYCCAHAEITDLRNIFAQKIKAEDTTDRDLAINLLKNEWAATRELKWQLARQKADNENLRLELNQLKGQMAARKGYFSGGLGIMATVTAVKDSLSKHLSRALRRRYRVTHSQFASTEHENRCEMPAPDMNRGVNRQTE